MSAYSPRDNNSSCETLPNLNPFDQEINSNGIRFRTVQNPLARSTLKSALGSLDYIALSHVVFPPTLKSGVARFQKINPSPQSNPHPPPLRTPLCFPPQLSLSLSLFPAQDIPRFHVNSFLLLYTAALFLQHAPFHPSTSIRHRVCATGVSRVCLSCIFSCRLCRKFVFCVFIVG